MKRYISLLRGINVSGQKKIKMADLKQLYETLDLKNVVTYIQSGNVIFDSTMTNKVQLKTILEKQIEQDYGFFAPIEIRTQSELEAILSNSPFDAPLTQQEGSKYLVTFLASAPSKAAINDTQKFVAASETLVINKNIAYLHCPNGYGKSKLSNTFLEKKLGVVATTRNWKTVNTLYELTKT